MKDVRTLHRLAQAGVFHFRGKNSPSRRSRYCLLLPILTAISCAPQVRRHDWSQYTGPGAEHFQKEEIEALDFVDPLEPWNRTITALNQAILFGVIDPVGYGYRAVIPRPVRDAITQFGSNLLNPGRALASLWQGKLKEARDETRRFVINTSLGVLGLFDVAAVKYGIEPCDDDFGRALAYSGWTHSRYLALPFYGPETGRDAVGLIAESLTDPAVYYFPARPALAFNELTDFVESHKQFVHTTYDPYALTRVYWLLERDFSPMECEFKSEQGPAVETLQTVFLTCQDEKFPSSLRTGRVRIDATGRDLPYNYRLQPNGPAPIVMMLPGFGAHRESNNVLSLAEIVYREGYSVAIISSALNWEFMERASTAAVPGHAPVDAHDVHEALDAVARDLDRRHLGRVGSKHLMGYSMGAFHTFYIAAQEQQPENHLIRFDSYVTLDSPVRLLYGAQKLDAFYNSPLSFPQEKRAARIKDILRKTLVIGREKSKWKDALPFTELEARFLVGLEFRLTLQSIIDNSQTRHDFGILESKRTALRRGAAYQEIFDYSFMEYMYGFVLPYYQQRDPAITGVQRLIDLNDLRSIGDALRQSGKIRHVASANDFLVDEEDIDWLTKALGPKNVTFFPNGGHLGGLQKPEFQYELIKALNGNHEERP